MGDAIFAAIETYERRQDRPWGQGALDAGTGKHSLRWLAGVKACPRWTAITASTSAFIWCGISRCGRSYPSHSAHACEPKSIHVSVV